MSKRKQQWSLTRLKLHLTEIKKRKKWSDEDDEEKEEQQPAKAKPAEGNGADMEDDEEKPDKAEEKR